MTRKMGFMAFAAGCLAAASAAAQETALIASQTVMPDGSLAEGRAVILAEDGTIARVIDAAAVSDDMRIVRFAEGSTLSPGLIEINSPLGVRGDSIEQKHVIDPEATVLEGLDAHSRELTRALRAGITAAMIAPSTQTVAPGRCATIRTWSDSGAADVLNEEAALSVVLHSSTFSIAREPSSRAGALHLLRSELEEQDSVFTQATGRLPLLVTCEEPQDVVNAITLFAPRVDRLLIVHSDDAVEIASDAAESDVAVIVGPYAFSSDQKTLEGAAALERAGANVILSGRSGTGDPDQLRLAAALAVRYGLSPEVARAAMTSRAAEAAGVADQVGSIAAGLAADLVVFSGDPLRADSRVREVWIAGKRIWNADAAEYNHETVIGATHED